MLEVVLGDVEVMLGDVGGRAVIYWRWCYDMLERWYRRCWRWC